MATSFSIQDILSSRDDKRPPALNLASSSSSGAAAAKKSSSQQLTVIESRNLSENKSLRKRSRDYASSESSASSSTLEVTPSTESGSPVLTDLDALSGSPAPTDLDALSLEDGRRKSKRPRTAFTSSQLKGLEYYFRLCPYPDTMGRDVISRVTGIDDAKIQVWFQNRRARYRKREQPLKMLPMPPSPSQPHASHTIHKPLVSQAASKLSPPPSLPIKPHTPPQGMFEMFYAAAMAYQLQQAYQRSHSPTSYIPLPYILPRAPPPNTSNTSPALNGSPRNESTPTSS